MEASHMIVAILLVCHTWCLVGIAKGVGPEVEEESGLPLQIAEAVVVDRTYCPGYSAEVGGREGNAVFDDPCWRRSQL